MRQQFRATQDWTLLAANDPVEVVESNGRRYPAVVDTKTADSTVVWVIDESGSRRAFDYREDVGLNVLVEGALIS
ncbi:MULTISPECIES: hypothetical protein [unclassified Arthrobacter]|uniref:hypothetical protein n=1 Tax=unclassified Arthrobacter TaxID=235627 RepID=UPI000971886C|nr:hypothetical protein [Arthrobacter sp. QXT-31]APX00422.1 hypothetical protein BWQ92_00565 [Arthrobacter sp. QXT-31]